MTVIDWCTSILKAGPDLTWSQEVLPRHMVPLAQSPSSQSQTSAVDVAPSSVFILFSKAVQNNSSTLEIHLEAVSARRCIFPER